MGKRRIFLLIFILFGFIFISHNVLAATFNAPITDTVSSPYEIFYNNGNDACNIFDSSCIRIEWFNPGTGAWQTASVSCSDNFGLGSTSEDRYRAVCDTNGLECVDGDDIDYNEGGTPRGAVSPAPNSKYDPKGIYSAITLTRLVDYCDDDNTLIEWYCGWDNGFTNPAEIECNCLDSGNNLLPDRCVECISDSQCGSNQDCVDNQCIASGTCADNDDDGYSSSGGVCGPIDCNDNNPSINPGESETCGNSIDDDCDGNIDEGCSGSSCTDPDNSNNPPQNGEDSLKRPGRAYKSPQYFYDRCVSGYPNNISEGYCNGNTGTRKSVLCPSTHNYCLNITRAQWASIGVSTPGSQDTILAACVQCAQDSHCGTGFSCNATYGCQAVPASCGDGIINAGEECDGSNLGGATCQSEGFPGGGTISCSSSCTLDTSQCISNLCGNGIIDIGEECDPDANPIFEDYGDGENQCDDYDSDLYTSGNLACDANTCQITTGQCSGAAPSCQSIFTGTCGGFENAADCTRCMGMGGSNDNFEYNSDEHINPRCEWRSNSCAYLFEERTTGEVCVVETVSYSCEEEMTSTDLLYRNSCNVNCDESGEPDCVKENIPCPRIISLPFFGVFGFILSIIAIALIYNYLLKKDK